MITVFGIFLGSLGHYLGGATAASIKAWSEIDPHLLLFVFLPPLIFESAFNSDWHIFKKIFWQVIIMAGPMLLVSTGLSAGMIYYVLGYNDDGEEHKFTMTAALLYGAIISATDPVAVVALLKELGASKQLSTLIEGESLLNDGTAMVVFYVFLGMIEAENDPLKEPATFGEVILQFCRLSGGGPIFGIVVGVITSAVLANIHNNFVLEVNTTICAAYIMFYFAEFTGLGFSGILALVALGLYMSFAGKT